MDKLVGFYKHLRDEEELSLESPEITQVHFEKPRLIPFLKKYDTTMAKIYLTTQRVLLLQLFLTTLSDLKSGRMPVDRESFSGVTGTWFEIPLRLIDGVETKRGFFARLLGGKEGLVIKYKSPFTKEVTKMIVGVDSIDMWKMQIESHMLLQAPPARSTLAPTAPAKGYCIYCGAQMSDSPFCPKCGKSNV